jgi:hypothetical protein
MIKKCPHCDKEIKYDKHQQFGGHITNCKSNPKKLETIAKIRKSTLDKNPILEYNNLICINCGKKYTLNIKKSYYERGEYKKCCCEKCAHEYSYSFVSGTKKIKCIVCQKEFDVDTRTYKFLCDECKNEKKNKKKKCKCCGDINCIFTNKCNSRLLKSLIKCFNFNSKVLGTIEYYTEYDRIHDLLNMDYIDNELSIVEISKKYNMRYSSLWYIFKSLEIKIRNISESQQKLIKNNKRILPCCKYPYKNGFHITWFGKEVFYRSNFELDYYKKLDENKIYYECESLRISYFDTQKNKERISVPDIYILNNNEITEIKSVYTYNEINMNDKIKKYKELGYNVKLIIGYGNKLFDNYKEFIY